MLGIPEILARVAPVTVGQYHRFPEFNANCKRTELIRGILIEKATKSPLHSSIARRLFMLLQGAMTPGYILLRQDPLTFADSEPEPDLAIVRGEEQDFSICHPSTAELVIVGSWIVSIGGDVPGEWPVEVMRVIVNWAFGTIFVQAGFRMPRYFKQGLQARPGCQRESETSP